MAILMTQYIFLKSEYPFYWTAEPFYLASINSAIRIHYYAFYCTKTEKKTMTTQF